MKNVAGYPEVMLRNKFSTTPGQKSDSRRSPGSAFVRIYHGHAG
jgi:hypothetical protein